MSNSQYQPNGKVCDRCGREDHLATRGTWKADGYEMACNECLTPAELVAFGIGGIDGE